MSIGYKSFTRFHSYAFYIRIKDCCFYRKIRNEKSKQEHIIAFYKRFIYYLNKKIRILQLVLSKESVLKTGYCPSDACSIASNYCELHAVVWCEIFVRLALLSSLKVLYCAEIT